MLRYCSILLIVALTASGVYAQDWHQLDGDQLFALARKTAFDGNREEARRMLLYILDRTPAYDEVRVFLARTYYWDHQVEQARSELAKVLTQNPKDVEAIVLLSDAEKMDGKSEVSLQVCENGLKYFPNNEELLLRKADLENTLGRNETAVETLNTLLTINPSHEAGSRLMKSIQTSRMKFEGGLFGGVDLFSKVFKPAYYSSLQLRRTNSWGSVLARINHSSRFGKTGIQGEIDLYPRITNGVYAYINYGYSGSMLFPKHRAGGELFARLPAGFEASAGVRYLWFNSISKVWIYTGSVGWYFSDYWISWRPYVTPSGPGTSFSSTLTLRRYLSDAQNFVGFMAGMGFIPDDRRIQTGTGLSADVIYILRSQRIGAMWQKSLGGRVTLSANVTAVRQELSFDQGAYAWIASTVVSIRKKF